MIQIYEQNCQWVGENTSLGLMVVCATEKEAILELCYQQEYHLMENYRNGKLRKVLANQKK